MAKIVELLREEYPKALCSLSYNGEGWKLMVMGRLSAQCTDARVNTVCEELFAKYPTPDKLAYADISDVERYVMPCGLYRMKARDIVGECRMLVEKYGGIVPDDMDTLLTFPGIGRKIANLLLGDIYKKPAIVTDTHCIRICGRLGMYPEKEKAPYKIEKILSPLVEPCEQSDLCHRLVLFGRDVCTARSPMCDICKIGDYGLCAHKNKEIKNKK